MNTFAIRYKRSAPAIRRSQPSHFRYRGPQVKAQQAEIRRIPRAIGAQDKFTIGQPNDKYEQEANRVAEQVMRMSDADVAQRQPENDEEEETLQTKPLADQITPLVQRQIEPEDEEEEEPLQEKSLFQRQVEEEEETLQVKPLADQITPLVQRQNSLEEEEEEPIQAKLIQRQPEEEDLQAKLTHKGAEHLQTKGTPNLSDDSEQKVHQMRGQGESLSEGVRQGMENKVGADFSNVRIHNNSASNDINKQINSRAFTLGNDIYFASGEYSPTTNPGKKLLAHELTHVVQQHSAAKMVRRSINPADTPSENAEALNKLRDLSTLNIPPIKQRHLSLYTQLAGDRILGRIRNYTRRRTAQTSVWKQNIVINEEDVANRLGALNPTVSLPTGANSPVNFRLANHADTLSFRKRSFLNNIMFKLTDFFIMNLCGY